MEIRKEGKDGGKYVYCVIESGERRSFGRGFGGRIVYTIPYRDISAVVSDTPVAEYEPSEANVLIHEKVVDGVMREYNILPVAFGNVFINEDRVRWMLARFYLTFKTYLKRLENKVEVGVKVFYDIEAVKQEVERTSEEVKRLKEKIASEPGKEAYFLKEKLNIIIEQEALKVAGERAYRYGVEIYETLKKHAEEACLMKQVGEEMILNAAFLIYKDKTMDFEKRLEEVKRRYEGKGLKFQFSGPWPPYNFSRIHIGR